ncbi:MAG: HNH endonuclease [Candidatus Aenigmarchaeota archaeon]|nr:HNH endonuclease [Candidatus Aenigmarchaeota archaeon]
MVKRKKERIRFSLQDKKTIASYQRQIDIFGNVICAYCRRSFPLDVMEVHHIIPLSKGGTDQPTNLCLLCPSCNRRIGVKKSKSKYKKIKPQKISHYYLKKFSYF